MEILSGDYNIEIYHLSFRKIVLNSKQGGSILFIEQIEFFDKQCKSFEAGIHMCLKT